ncbi:hydrophobin [Fomes fomentarius]|nr:hydrophobin [Fomes fomentarius]
MPSSLPFSSQSDSPAAAKIIALLGIDLKGVVTQVGLTCSPINVIGVGSGNSCSAKTVCCQNNSYGGAISIGCVPVSL